MTLQTQYSAQHTAGTQRGTAERMPILESILQHAKYFHTDLILSVQQACEAVLVISTLFLRRLRSGKAEELGQGALSGRARPDLPAPPPLRL